MTFCTEWPQNSKVSRIHYQLADAIMTFKVQLLLAELTIATYSSYDLDHMTFQGHTRSKVMVPAEWYYTCLYELLIQTTCLSLRIYDEHFRDSQTLTSQGQTLDSIFANLKTSYKGTISNTYGEYEVPASKIVIARLLAVTQTILTSVMWPSALYDPKFEKRVEIPIFSMYTL